MLTLNNLYSFISSLPMATLVLDKEGMIKLANSNAEHIFNISNSELKKKNIFNFFNKNNIFKLIKKAIEDENSFSEYNCILNNSFFDEQTVDIHVSKCLEENLLFMIQQNSIIKKASDVSKTNNFGLLKGLTNTFTHSIKNPVTSILGASDLLNNELNLGSSTLDKELVNIIKKESYIIKTFIDNLSEVSENLVLNKKDINIHEIINKSISRVKSNLSEKINILLDFDPSLPDLFIDGNHMENAFYNILKNAYEASNENKIKISTSINHSMYSEPKAIPGKMKLPIQITFQDNGPGIDKMIEDDIFQPFISTKNNHNGLGLSFVAQVIDLHQGLIEAKTNSYETSFHIYLPLIKNINL